MNKSMLGSRLAARVVLILSLVSPVAVWGQEPPAKPEVKPPAESELREQTIYIPYTKLRGVFEKEGRGVFVTYDKFQELWKEAREKKGLRPDEKPPVGALITDIDNEATVGKDVVRVVAKLKIEVLAEGWSEIPLRLADSALLSAKLGDAPARVVFDPTGGYKLLVEKKGKEPAQLELTLEYAKSITKAPGQNSVAFEAPQAPVSRWKIVIPEADAKVNIHPHLAATQAPAAVPEKKPDAEPEDKPEEKPAAKETTVLAFVGAAPQVRIEWTPKTEGATGLAALANVNVQEFAILEEGAMRTHVKLAYDITRAELSQLVIEVPADQKVVNVFDPNVRQWEAEKGAADALVQQIKVQLFAPTRGAQNVVVELEKFSDDIGKKEVVLPVVKAIGAGRQQGVLAVKLAGELKGEIVRKSGLLQLDAAELADMLKSDIFDFTYRYATVPFELALATDKVLPRVRADELVEAFLEPEQITLNLLALYQIERAGVFQLEIAIPAGFDVRQAVGHAVAAKPGIEAVEAAQVDAFHVDGEMKTRLLVNLSRKALGRVGLLVELQKRLDDPNLLTPTGKTSDLPLVLPRVVAASVERATGKLVVYAPESLRVNPGKQGGVRTVSLAEAMAGFESCRGERFPLLREALAFAFTQEPTDLVLAAERRKPFITARQLLVASVEPGVVKYEARLFYDVLYSGVKSLRLDVPKKLAGDIRVATPGVREKKIEPAPKDLTKGFVAWSLSGDKEFLGPAEIRLTWEHKTADLAVGKSLNIDIPTLQPREVDRAWGQIVAQKAESIDVAPLAEKVKGLRPIDPQHDLMPGANISDAARAFEFQDEWSLALVATRYKLEEVKRTSIERAVVRMVATRGNQVSVQALYRMRSARQRLAIKLPAGVDPAKSFDAQPLRINGQPKTLERGDQDEFFVPLAGRSPEEPFLLELRYTQAGSQTLLELPEFPEEPAVQQVHLCAYLPQELALLGARGPWTSDAASQGQVTLGGNAVDYSWAVNLISDLTSGLSLTEQPATSFSTDGKLYIYSTLRPAGGTSGALSLVTINKTGLNVLVFALVALGGLFLLRKPLSQRLFAIAAFVIGLILVGVFLPTFATQLLDVSLVLAIVIVLLAWFGWYAATTLPRTFPPAAATATASPFATPPVTEGGRRLELTPVTPTPPPPPTPPTPESKPPDAPENKSGYQPLGGDAPKNDGPSTGGPSNG